MKDSRKILIRSTTIFFLLTASAMLGGCSILGGAYDAVMWAPRKIWSVTGDKLFGVHNEQQTDMGSRRKPSGNPQGGGIAPGYPAMPQGDGVVPQGIKQQGEGYPALSPYGEGHKQGSAAQHGYPQMPPIPQDYQFSAPGNKQQQIQPVTGDLQPPDITDSSDPDGGAEAAYSRGGGVGASDKKKGWKIPFISNNYKMEMRYEPLSADLVFDKNDVISVSQETEEYIEPQGSVLNESASRNKLKQEKLNEGGEKSARAASMFPLEQYAPAPSNVIQITEDKGGASNTYPKLGRVPERPLNFDNPSNAEAEMESIKKEAQESEDKRFNIHNIQPETIATKVGNTDNTNKPTSQESNKIDKLPLVKRRPDHNSPKDSTYPVAIAPEALKNDAVLMDKIINSNSTNQVSDKKQEPNKGFFASLHDKIFPPSPKSVLRKSLPPAATNDLNKVSGAGQDSGHGDVSDGIYYNNSPTPIAKENVISGNNTLPIKNYDTDQGSLLPKSRYTDRRKVPQQD